MDRKKRRSQNLSILESRLRQLDFLRKLIKISICLKGTGVDSGRDNYHYTETKLRFPDTTLLRFPVKKKLGQTENKNVCFNILARGCQRVIHRNDNDSSQLALGNVRQSKKQFDFANITLFQQNLYFCMTQLKPVIAVVVKF